MSSFSITFTLQDINAAAQQFWQFAHTCRILAFSGEMGAGKTTFIHALCTQLGVEDAVSSPTFALINEYRFPTQGKEQIIYHMDWYRLRDTEEAINAGLEDCLLQKDAYCFVEWPEKALNILPHSYVWVEITLVSLNERRLSATIVSEATI